MPSMSPSAEAPYPSLRVGCRRFRIRNPEPSVGSRRLPLIWQWLACHSRPCCALSTEFCSNTPNGYAPVGLLLALGDFPAAEVMDTLSVLLTNMFRTCPDAETAAQSLDFSPQEC